MEEHISLPQAFCQRMEELLGKEYGAFLAGYDRERYYGLRQNPLKVPDAFAERMPFDLEKVPWAQEGYYYQAAQQPGRHVLHEAGAYYIQEPSAMAVVEILDPRPGERILDLCAAPGGKSTQIAGRMAGDGLLAANEIVPERAKILSQNVERMGITNCVVCSERPERLSVVFPAFFDRILVDAPCSGEGMFRKEEAARQEWSPEQVKVCADRQQKILNEAAKMLRPGGVLVYSTCTFAPEENEGAVSAFVRTHNDFIIEETDCSPAFSKGRPEWISEPVEGIEFTMRLWPHRLKGEGHYIARLSRKGEPVKQSADFRVKGRMKKPGDGKLREAVSDFLIRELGIQKDWMERKGGEVIRFGEQIYLVPEEMISLTGLKVERPGLCLLVDKKNRFEPAHALAMALSPGDTERVWELTKEDAKRYLRGESISCGQEKGWLFLAYDGCFVGCGKASGGQIKNHYPKGLRKNR